MYIGTQPYQGFRARHTYTATAGQTSFSGAGAENVTLTYSDEMYIDVYQNGVKLSPADYTATSGTTVVLATGATVSDIVEVVKYDAFSVADTVSAKDGGGFGGDVSSSGGWGSMMRQAIGDTNHPGQFLFQGLTLLPQVCHEITPAYEEQKYPDIFTNPPHFTAHRQGDGAADNECNSIDNHPHPAEVV